MKDLKTLPLQCIIINWDGTLVSSEAQIHEAYLHCMKLLKINPTWSREDTYRQNGRSPAEIFSDKTIWHGMGSVAKDFFYSALTNVKKEKPELLKLKEGAVELLSWFCHHPAKPRIVILGNKTQGILSLEVKQMELLEMIDFIVGSKFDISKDKPSLSAFEHAIHGLHITDPKLVVHIGDNPKIDPAFARDCGATSILIADTPAAHAQNLTELLQKLNQE